MGDGIRENGALKAIQKEIEKIDDLPLSRKTDKQLAMYDKLSAEYSERYKNMDKEQKVRQYRIGSRATKLTAEQVKEIRSKYHRYTYGKLKLSREYGVSASVVYRIIKNKSWKQI